MKMILVCSILLIIFVYLMIGVLVTMAFADPPKSDKMIRYHINVENRQPFISPGSEILIPALVDDNNVPVFSESELNAIGRCHPYGLFPAYRYPCNITYTTTQEGTMISLKPEYSTNARSFDIEFITQEFRPGTYSLSPIIKQESELLASLPTLPIYIRNSTFTGKGRVPVAYVNLDVWICGYDPGDPDVCKGYTTRQDLPFAITGETLPVRTSVFGDYNGYRRCINPVTWSLVLLNPDRCR